MRLPEIDYSKQAVTPFHDRKNSLERNAQLVNEAAMGFVKIKEADDDLKAEQAAIELIGVDEQLTATLNNVDVINLDSNPFSKNANEAMRNGMSEDDKILYGDTGYIPTERVMTTAYDQSMRDAYDVITEGMNDSQKAKVKMRFMPQYAKSVGGLTVRKINLEVDRAKAGYQNAYDIYLQNGNVVAAEDLAQKAMQTGIWSTEYYNDQREKGRQHLVSGMYLQELANATTEDEIFDLQTRLLRGAMQDPATTRQLLTDTNNVLSNLTKSRDVRYQSGKDRLLIKRANGTLTNDEIIDSTNTDEVPPQFAVELLDSLKTEQTKPVKSPQSEMNSIRQKIMMISNTNGGSVTVGANAESIRRMINGKSTGIDPLNVGGEPITVTLTGEDALKLIAETDEAEKRAQRPTGFDDASKLIRNATGTTEAAYVSGGSNEKQRAAYQDFYTGLVQYVEREGAKADPVDWVNKNYAKYDVENYSAKGDDLFLKQFPQFSTPEYTETKTKKSATTGRETPVQVLMHDKVKQKLRKDLLMGASDVWKIEQQYYLLDGKYKGGNIEELKALEPQGQFYQNIQGINGGNQDDE